MVSSFAGPRKLKPFKLLFKNSECIDAFSSLGENIELDKGTAKKFERFALHMYCHNVLTQHSMQASYQTYLWRQCFNPMIDADEPVNYGWYKNDDTLDMQWMTCNPAPDEVTYS